MIRNAIPKKKKLFLDCEQRQFLHLLILLGLGLGISPNPAFALVAPNTNFNLVVENAQFFEPFMKALLSHEGEFTQIDGENSYLVDPSYDTWLGGSTAYDRKDQSPHEVMKPATTKGVTFKLDAKNKELVGAKNEEPRSFFSVVHEETQNVLMHNKGKLDSRTFAIYASTAVAMLAALPAAIPLANELTGMLGYWDILRAGEVLIAMGGLGLGAWNAHIFDKSRKHKGRIIESITKIRQGDLAKAIQITDQFKQDVDFTAKQKESAFAKILDAARIELGLSQNEALQVELYIGSNPNIVVNGEKKTDETKDDIEVFISVKKAPKLAHVKSLRYLLTPKEYEKSNDDHDNDNNSGGKGGKREDPVKKIVEKIKSLIEQTISQPEPVLAPIPVKNRHRY